MARTFTITLPDGKQHVYQNVPDDVTPDAVSARAQSEFGVTPAKIDGGRGSAAQPEPEQSPRWDVLGDIGRAAKESAGALVDDLSGAFPSVEARQAKSAENREKYGLIGGIAKGAFVDPLVTMGHALRVPLDALGVVSSPLSGTARATLGSALSYLPAPPGVDPKAAADAAVDTALMGLGPRRAGGPRVAMAEAAATNAERQAATVRNQARAKVAKRLEQDGLTAQDVLDAQSEARNSGDKLTLMDIGGENTRGLAGAVYRTPGEGKQRIGNFLDERDVASASLLADDIQASVGKGSTYEAQQALTKARSESSRPLWDEATSVGQVWSPRLQQFLVNPEVQSGLRNGLKLEAQDAVAENRAFVPEEYGITGFDEAGDPIISGTPTMKAMAVAKEALDGRIAELRDPLTGRPTKAGLSLKKFRDAFVKELDAINPKYKTARDAWSGPTQTMEAMRDGRQHFSRQESDAQIRAEFNELSPGDKEFYRLGAAEAKIAAVEGAADAADKSKRVINSIRDRKRFEILFDNPADAKRFMDSVARKRKAFDTKIEVKGNSKTAARNVEDEDNLSAVMEGARSVRDLATGNWFGLADQAMRVRQLGLRNNPALNSEIANILTNPDFPVGGQGNFLAPEVLPPRANYFANAGLANELMSLSNATAPRSEPYPNRK